jgi:hypothetical protein
MIRRALKIRPGILFVNFRRPVSHDCLSRAHKNPTWQKWLIAATSGESSLWVLVFSSVTGDNGLDFTVIFQVRLSDWERREGPGINEKRWRRSLQKCRHAPARCFRSLGWEWSRWVPKAVRYSDGKNQSSLYTSTAHPVKLFSPASQITGLLQS